MPLYEISFNAGCTVKDPYVYKFSNTKNIELHVKKNNATIRYRMKTQKTPDELIAFKDGVFKDAYRKIFLLHGILFDQDINVKTVTISVDEIKETYTKNTEGFPFIYSMISKSPMQLPKEWKTKEFCYHLIENPKSKSSNDFKQISVLAFLCSKGRPYIVDRFTNLWTSMNAYYNWYADIYNEYFRKKYHYDRETYEKIRKNIPDEMKYDFDNLRNETLSNGRQFSFITSGDANCMKLLMESIDTNGAIIKTSQFDSNVAMRAKLHAFANALSALSYDELERLYSYSMSLLQGRQINTGDEFYDLVMHIKSMNRQNEYFFLVFEYPYICRCNYLHGSKALLLLSYENEFEIRRLKAASFFVEKFLSEKIPLMLIGDTTISEELLDKKMKKVDSSTLKIMERHQKAIEELLNKINVSITT